MIHLEILTLLWPLLTGRDKIFYHFSIHLYILSKFKPSDCFDHHVGPFSHVVEHRSAESEVQGSISLRESDFLLCSSYTRVRTKNILPYFILIEGIMHGTQTV